MNILAEKAVVQTCQRLHKLPLGAVTAKGWLKDQLIRSKEGTGGHLDELEPAMIARPFIDYSAFKRLPYENHDADPTFAAGWSGEISGTYWTGLIELAFTLRDDDLIAKATAWVEGVLAHQEADGYLGSYPAHTDRMADYNPWSACWCYRALFSFYEATGRQDVLDAAYRGLLWFCENWRDHKTDYAGSTIIEPMVIGYAYTGDGRLLDFCRDWLSWLEGNSKWQNRVSAYLSDSLPYNSMHAVAYGEELKNPAIVYCASGNETYLQASLMAARKALDTMVQTTGGISSCSEFLSPRGAANETEYCNFSTYSHSYSWLAMATGEASWGDEIERIVFNGAQGARKKDEKANAYMSAPNQLHAASVSTLHGTNYDLGAYAPCANIACCPVQAVRTVPEFVRGMCMQDKDGQLYLFCYGPASIRSSALSFEMDTLYPFRDTVTLKITEADKQILHLRIPGWCKQPSAEVNGKPARLELGKDGFARLEAGLNTGDSVVITFPMEISVSRIDDADAASKFPICIERGPLVYALPVAEKWATYAGRPITPLPEGWSWYTAHADFASVDPDRFLAYKKAPWSKAIREDISPADIWAEEVDISGYVWEDPPVKLHVPMYHAPFLYVNTGSRTHESWQIPAAVEGEEADCILVPHGCTNLRVTYLPRANI